MSTSPAPTDHPRSRGVYVSAPDVRPRKKGSSPLARGLPWNAINNIAVLGIIPARAGFTNEFKSKVITAQDHPRSRGVYITPTRALSSSPGSSPLARGLLPCVDFNIILFRIIPARAGFTRFNFHSHPVKRDHPRSRGVYQICEGLIPHARGSSPLARGLRFTHARAEIFRRIIPARAGFTCEGGE